MDHFIFNPSPSHSNTLFFLFSGPHLILNVFIVFTASLLFPLTHNDLTVNRDQCTKKVTVVFNIANMYYLKFACSLCWALL